MFFRSFDGVIPLFWQFKILLPRALFTIALRAALDEKLGNFEQAAAIFSHLIRTLESREAEYRAKDPDGRLMTFLYNRLARIYLASGRIDDATVVVIRANRFLGIDCLPSIPDLDVRAARIIKAGIAAGKLLDEGGLATLTVRAALMRKKDGEAGAPEAEKKKPTKRFEGLDRLGPRKERTVQMAKVLPFHRPAPT